MLLERPRNILSPMPVLSNTHRLRTSTRGAVRISTRSTMPPLIRKSKPDASALQLETARHIMQELSFLNQEASSSQSQELRGAESQGEDAWLNDVMPPLQAKTLPQAQPEALKACIGPGHVLWPMVLGLSERIWQELWQKREGMPTREAAMMEFVRKRAITLLRANCSLAARVQNLAEAEEVFKSVVNEVLGYGPLEALLRDESISEIMAIGPRRLYIERDGTRQEVAIHFEDERHMLRIAENILRRAGRSRGGYDEPEPKQCLFDVHLPDGTLVHIVTPPGAVKGPAITIRKRAKTLLHLTELVQRKVVSQEMTDFLQACVQARLNIVICGEMRSGKTTLLNALAACIPEEERIVTIEEKAELQLHQKHVVPLEAGLRSANSSDGRVTMRDLVVNAMRMFPERLIIDECQGDETVEMLRAMYVGHDGALLTMYARNVRDCLNRLEMLWPVGAGTRGAKLPPAMIRAQLASVLDVIVYLARCADGSWKVLNIARVQGVDGDRIQRQSVFHSNEKTRKAHETYELRDYPFAACDCLLYRETDEDD